MSRALNYIDIAGRPFRMGKVDGEMHKAARPHMLLIEKLHVAGGGLTGERAIGARVEIAALLLKEHAPELSADWLSRHLTAEQIEALVDEFLHQTVILVNSREP